MFFQGNEKYNCATYLRLSRSDGDQQESNSISFRRNDFDRISHRQHPGVIRSAAVSYAGFFVI